MQNGQMRPIIGIVAPALGMLLMRQWLMLLHWIFATCVVGSCLQPAAAAHVGRQAAGMVKQLAMAQSRPRPITRIFGGEPQLSPCSLPDRASISQARETP